MKKIFLLLVALTTVTLCFAQHPVGTDSLILQTLGSSKTFVKSKGVIGSDSGLVNAHFVDTTAANLSKIKNYPGAQIAVGSDIYVRDITATAWLLMGQGAAAGNLQQVTDIGNTTTNSIIDYNSVQVIGADTANNSVSVSSPSKGLISQNIGISKNPALTWTLPWLAGPTDLFADSADSRALQLPNNNGVLALSVNGIMADVYGNIVDTSHRTDTAFIITTIHDSLITQGPDTTFLIYPLYAPNDSTIAFKADSLNRLDYNITNYDTTTWLPLTLITKQYLEDRIGGLTGGGGSGGGEAINQTLLIGNITKQKMIWVDSAATASGSGLYFTEYRPQNYNTSYGAGLGTSASFTQGYGYYPGVNADGRPNVVGLFWGYNGGFNTPVIASEPTWGFRSETWFDIAGIAHSEFHFPEFKPITGVSRRPNSLYINNTTGVTTWTTQVDSYNFYQGATDTIQLSLDPINAKIGFNTNGALSLINQRIPTNTFIATLGTSGATLETHGTSDATSYLTLPASVITTSATVGSSEAAAMRVNVTQTGYSAFKVQSSLSTTAMKGYDADVSTTNTFDALNARNLGSGGTNQVHLTAQSSGNGKAQIYLADTDGYAWFMRYTGGTNNKSLIFSTFTDSALVLNQGLSIIKHTYPTSIGLVDPVASAQLDVQSTTKGILPPRMTTTQKNAISSPAEGLMVYDLTLHKLYVYDGSVWQAAW